MVEDQRKECKFSYLNNAIFQPSKLKPILVPWRKLLPTGDSHGLGVFLTNPHHQLKKSSYWSISVLFNSQSESASSLVLEHSMIIDVRNRNTLDILTNFNSTDNEPKAWFVLRIIPAQYEKNAWVASNQ